MMVEDGKVKIDNFDGHVFGFWKLQIEDYIIREKDAWTAIIIET